MDPENCIEARKELKNDVFRAMRQSMTKTPPIARNQKIPFDASVFSESHHSLTKRSKTQTKNMLVKKKKKTNKKLKTTTSVQKSLKKPNYSELGSFKTSTMS